MLIANRMHSSNRQKETPPGATDNDTDLHLKQVVAQLKRNNQTKDLLLTKIGHELLTPLNGVIGSLGLALEHSDKSRTEFITTALQSASNLHQLIGDIVDLSQLTRGELRLKKEAFSITDLLHGLTTLASQEAHHKGLEWRQAIDLETDQMLNGDGKRIEQILRSLIHNAIKFTESGSISLSIRGPLENQRLMVFRAIVEDTGIGIGEAEQVHIFNSFYQVEDFCNRNHQGSGVGLSLAYLLVKQMGGEISVQSAPNKGSRFEIFIPLPLAKPNRRSTRATPGAISLYSEEKTQRNPLATQPPSDQPTSSKNNTSGTTTSQIPGASANIFSTLGSFHVLIVEDNAVNQMVLKGLLTKVGITSEVAANGKIALHMLEHGDFDTILMDCQMPIMDGYSAAQAIRQLPSPQSELPIIAVTANITEKDKQKCFDVGMNDFLTKPIQANGLYSTLLKWFEKNPTPSSKAQQKNKS